jgi:hypothetical protein
MVRYEGRAKETTTVPNKPIPTGFKVWAVAQRGFLLCWNWHVPGDKNGPVGIRTPRELGGTKKEGKGGNKTQAVILHLIGRLPPPPAGSGYHCYLDNLFVSHKFLLFARSRGIGLSGTCRDNGGVIQELLNLKKSDKKDIIPWGETHWFPTIDGKVCQIGWKDQAFVLMMSTVMTGELRVLRKRKRPKETSSKAKTARVPFADGSAEKVLSIPAIADHYNHFMGAVDEVDHLTAQNSGLRHVVRGGHQALEHWLLRVVLINSYLLSLCSEVPEPKNRPINFRSQQDFRRQLIGSLVHLSKGWQDSQVVLKRRIGKISQGSEDIPRSLHQRVHMGKKGWCVNCEGLRATDRPKKRVALAQIAANERRQSSHHSTRFGCKQCDVFLCKKGSCWAVFHR